MSSRRDFLATGISTAAAAWLSPLAVNAQRLRLPLGIQLYSVRNQLPKDFEGTLRMIGSLGYREVEAAGFYDHTIAEVKQAMRSANLKCVSSHYGYGALAKDFDKILEFNQKLGVDYLVCASHGHRHPVPAAQQDIYSLDDWMFMADQLNAFGEKVASAGLRFAYHNHAQEFSPTDGAIPYVELMRRTNPAHVSMEMDCGWVVAAGGDPIQYLHDYSSRIVMLHVKDFVRPTPAQVDPLHYTVTELGRGYIDYNPIFREAAKTNQIKHVFVEQEEFDISMRESLSVDAAYMHRLLG